MQTNKWSLLEPDLLTCNPTVNASIALSTNNEKNSVTAPVVSSLIGWLKDECYAGNSKETYLDSQRKTFQHRMKTHSKCES